MSQARGQAVTEVALGLLLLVPVLLGGIYLAEAAMFRLEATEAANEPMWDATAFAHHSYTGSFDQTPSAVAAANALAQGRQRARALLFTQTSVPQVRCTAGTGIGWSARYTGVAQRNNGGMSCTSRLVVDPKGLTRFFLDRGRGAMFNEPLENMQRNFDFCQNERCRAFELAVGDWGLTNRNAEDAECHLTMDGCANPGFYGAAKAVYEDHRDPSGTAGRAHERFIEGLIVHPPRDYSRVTDFQMSFRGEESGFLERVPVVEGEPEWRTTPFLQKREEAYRERHARFLGL